MYYLIMMINIFMTMMFFFMKHPLSMGMILLFQTLNLSLMTSMMSYSYWFSYILFLVMIGGMLILFIYMTSLVSNEMFYSIKMNISLIILMMFILFIIMMIMDYTMITPMLKNSNTLNFLMKMIKNENLMSLNMIYNLPNNMITFMLMNYLFLTLIAVVKITNFNNGPLRQKF